MKAGCKGEAWPAQGHSGCGRQHRCKQTRCLISVAVGRRHCICGGHMEGCVAGLWNSLIGARRDETIQKAVVNFEQRSALCTETTAHGSLFSCKKFGWLSRWELFLIILEKVCRLCTLSLCPSIYGLIFLGIGMK